MSVFAMESQYMKTIMIHLADKSNFILSDHETHCKALLVLQKVSVSRKCNSNQEISTILCELVC